MKVKKRLNNAQERAMIADRRAQVWALRVEGHTLQEIARALSVAVGTVKADLDAYLQRQDATSEKLRDEYRALHLSRIQMARQALAPKIAAGDCRAIEADIRLSEREAKLLGLDAPTRQEVHNTGSGAMVNLYLPPKEQPPMSLVMPPAELPEGSELPPDALEDW